MDWIRKNPHLLTLLLVGLGVLAASGMAVLSANGFNEKFSDVMVTAPQGEKIPPLDVTRLDQAQAELDKPQQWKAASDPQNASAEMIYPFVPPLYSVEGDKPTKAGLGTRHRQRLTGEPIPDKWFLENRLPLTDPNVALQDPDGDGFSNEDEWLGKTDPNRKDAHPPYHTRLFVRQYIRVPFLLRLRGYDGDPQKDKPEDITFQINFRDMRAPSAFLKLGEKIGSTKFQLEKFEYKTAPNPKTGDVDDVSELTLRDTELNTVVVLVLNRITDSPDSFAQFVYLWPKPVLEFRVRKLGQFVLQPDKESRYQLLDINDDQAVIKLPSGETQTIPRLPAGYQ